MSSMVCMGTLLHTAAQGMPQRPDQCSHVNAGDYVDRGAWGLEVLLVMIAWKLAFPRQVFLLRGKAWMRLHMLPWILCPASHPSC